MAGGHDDNDKPVQGDAAALNVRIARAQALVEQVRAKALAQAERRKAERTRDEALVERAKAGDGLAFRRLVELHQGKLFAVAFGMLRDRDEAMDAVQDAFIKAHRKLADFEGAAAFSTWLYRIVVNLAIDRKRADARKRKVDADDALATVSSDDDVADGSITSRLVGTNPLKNMGDAQLGRELGRALSTLTEEHRAILLLREVEGMAYEEIAETLGVPKGTVMSRLFHARKNMQRELRPYLGLDEGDGLDGAPEEKPAPSGKPRGRKATVGVTAPSADHELDEAGATDERQR